MLTCATSVPRFQNRKVIVQEFACELKVMLLLTECPSESHYYNKKINLMLYNSFLQCYAQDYGTNERLVVNQVG